MEHETDPRLASAVRNNALWCDAICRAHGAPGAFVEPWLWLTRAPAPRFYPNVITLANPDDVTDQIAAIRDLVDARMPGSWAVKDSFARLDLTSLGFRQLLAATWCWRSGAPPRSAVASAGPRWTAIREPAVLEAWERAWQGDDPAAQPAAPSRLFPPSLLADDRITFLSANWERQIVAGAIANRMAGVVGLSNLFLSTGAAGDSWVDCLPALNDVAPGLPVVGYFAAGELAQAEQVGFVRLGPLQVWTRDMP